MSSIQLWGQSPLQKGFSFTCYCQCVKLRVWLGNVIYIQICTNSPHHLLELGQECAVIDILTVTIRSPPVKLLATPVHSHCGAVPALALVAETEFGAISAATFLSGGWIIPAMIKTGPDSLRKVFRRLSSCRKEPTVLSFRPPSGQRDGSLYEFIREEWHEHWVAQLAREVVTPHWGYPVWWGVWKGVERGVKPRRLFRVRNDQWNSHNIIAALLKCFGGTRCSSLLVWTVFTSEAGSFHVVICHGKLAE